MFLSLSPQNIYNTQYIPLNLTNLTHMCFPQQTHHVCFPQQIARHTLTRQNNFEHSCQSDSPTRQKYTSFGAKTGGGWGGIC